MVSPSIIFKVLGRFVSFIQKGFPAVGLVLFQVVKGLDDVILGVGESFDDLEGYKEKDSVEYDGFYGVPDFH